MTEEISAVLAGCGGISRAWLDAIRGIPDVRMVGFVDIREEAARARAEEFGWHDAVVADDLQAVLAATRPDVVFDCTVPEAHLQSHPGGAAPRLPRAGREAAGRLAWRTRGRWSRPRRQRARSTP